MAVESETQPGYLTLTELLANLGLFAGVGYWFAGAMGAGIGAGLILTRYAYLIWRAIRLPTGVGPDAEPGDASDPSA